MKTLVFYVSLLLFVVVFSSCGSSKKVEKSPIETFVMPCSELVSGNGVLRAWASGKSDSEMTARKKAQMAASTDLAAMLERVVNALLENNEAIVSETNAGISKSLFIEKATLTVKQSLQGVTIVCDRWVKDETTGQYTNYIVMELRGEEYLRILYESLHADNLVLTDKVLLEEQFYKLVNGTAVK